MAIRNKASVYINGRNLTHYAVMPLKWGNLLDERLDEMYLSLRMCPFENFKPLTPVEIHYSNQRYFGNTNDGAAETMVKRYIVADDANAAETPVGSGLYNHDLYLIELTKILECITVDTNTFTNDLGRNYTKNAKTTIVEQNYLPDSAPHTPSNYKSPIPNGEFTFVGAYTIFPYTTEQPGGFANDVYRITITDQYGNELFDRGTDNIAEDTPITLSLTTGITYNAAYKWISQRTPIGGSTTEITSTITYAFVPVENYYPLKQWTITDVINRLLDIAEPLRQGDKPRFRLQGVTDSGTYTSGSQAERFDKILAPQFSFTKSTLRECLQQCGAIVHGEPRVDVAEDTDGEYVYEVSFDLYGQTDRAGIYAKPYIQKTVSQLIDSYATSIDSSAENLVNQLDKYSGVITEPYASGYKTVRTEVLYVRITDANMLIQTQYPIYSVEKLECGYIPSNTSIIPPTDVTAYLFESSVYNSRLSSYTSEYPYSKAYALYYTQGQKNIYGLNFKPEHPIDEVFENYAIFNILNRATGKTIDLPLGTDNNNEYPLLAFRVTYIPFYTSRVGQTKVNYQDYPREASLIYNQQANVIESRYYGENLKGVIARIGNVEKTMTFILARLHEIPQAGQMYDEDYYISAVSVEFLPTFIKCTLGLSKDFNRLSQYIGISSVKRFSEVSQGQAVERNTLWKEYVVIGDAEEADTADADIRNLFMSALRDTFLMTGSYTPVTCATAYGGTYQQPQREQSQIDIKDQCSISYSNQTFIITVNTTAQTDQRITVNATMVYSTTMYQNESNNIQIRFYGQTGTFDAHDGVSVAGDLTVIHSVTIFSAFYTDYQYPLPLVTLPVVSSAFGNSIAFSWAYEDNYSAGAISQHATGGVGNTTVDGYFQNNYQYTDYYGRMYYYTFALLRDAEPISDIDEQTRIGTALPKGDANYSNRVPYISTNTPRILRKDNREALQCNFQVDFVSNRKGLIIGSALAAYSPLIRGDADYHMAAKLYLFEQPLNKFIGHVEGALDIDLSEATAYSITVNAADTDDGTFSVTAGAFATSGKAWAICTNQISISQTVEDEQGNVTPQTVQKGGDVLIAQNMDFAAGDAFPTVYFTKKKEVFDKSVWIANK